MLLKFLSLQLVYFALNCNTLIKVDFSLPALDKLQRISKVKSQIPAVNRAS